VALVADDGPTMNCAKVLLYPPLTLGIFWSNVKLVRLNEPEPDHTTLGPTCETVTLKLPDVPGVVVGVGVTVLVGVGFKLDVGVIVGVGVTELVTVTDGVGVGVTVLVGVGSKLDVGVGVTVLVGVGSKLDVGVIVGVTDAVGVGVLVAVGVGVGVTPPLISTLI